MEQKKVLKSLKQIIFLAIFVFCIVPFVSSAPPFSTSTSTTGYVLAFSEVDIIKVNTPFDVNIHVFNVSNGNPIPASTTLNCTLHLYNQTGDHIYDGRMIRYTQSDHGVQNEFVTRLTKGNFSSTGTYELLVQCNSTDLGGAIKYSLQVTNYGEELTTASAILYSIGIIVFILLFVGSIIFIFSFSGKDEKGEEGELLSINVLKYAKAGLMLLSYTLFVVIIFLISNIFMAYLNDQSVGKFFFILFKVLMRLLYLFIVLTFLWAFVRMFKDIQNKKFLERGGYG